MDIIQTPLGDIRCHFINDEYWFANIDICKCLCVRNARDAAGRLDENFKQKMSLMDRIGRNQQNSIFINQIGLMKLAISCQKIPEEDKTEFLNILSEGNFIDNIQVVNTTEENEFYKDLKEFLKPFDVKILRQYPVCNQKYFIDFYLPELNVAVEYDENGHRHYDQNKEKIREKEIKDELNCKIVRVSDDNSNCYNLGLIMSELL